VSNDPLILLAVGIVVLLLTTVYFRLHAFLGLILASLTVSAMTSSSDRLAYYLKQGYSDQKADALSLMPAGVQVGLDFGDLAGKIGVLIALAAIIAGCLQKTGSTDRIVRTILGKLGARRAPVALTGSAYALGIPVFSDTVLYLMLPLARSMALLTGKHYLLCVLGIALAIANTHVIIPPSPGPLFVASQLGVSLGAMIAAGFFFSAVTCVFGYSAAKVIDRRMNLSVRALAGGVGNETGEMLEKADEDLPPFWLAALPIMLPLFLISLGSIWSVATSTQDQSVLDKIIINVGSANVALSITALFLLAQLAQMHGWKAASLAKVVTPALHSAGAIILIIGAGGAFGTALQKCGIGPVLAGFAESSSIGILPLAFLITILFRTVTGSATVAMITSSSILAGVIVAAPLDFHPVYLAMVIGFGSKIFPWINDAFFWILCQVGGLTVGETLRSWSILNSAMGVFGFGAVVVVSKLYPAM
jgi:gluconate:H+ symporter, GntP family